MKMTVERSTSDIAFKVYNLNSDGFIDPSDLFSIMRIMVGSSLSDTQLQQIVDKTMVEVDVIDKDGKISFEEFKRSMALANVGKRLQAEC
ncbi:hypothetical protein M427DRAFT_33127 [Gonapodya prolifera JEL478]|uniref:Calcineurin subunit B n=1 Tax=Gonapodya prolifera (strain JEL478) TaxID=1344416 RepID=A0A139ACD6_GONPJ|nr:hypothetical protein M427DRAFT_33127 [Gonapodya prolifera JEL478]|eukprot:KXS14437.1 hypothetical protein M427DRAFT_33127 [Gonapodya prolifera JEL478]